MLSLLPFRPVLVGLVAGFALTAVSCGARDKDAPPPPQKAQALQHCRSFEELMPRFHASLETGQTEGLRTVIRDHLMVGAREGDTPPINDVMRAIFATLTRFAKLPAEAGAPDGDLCAKVPPPISQAHPMCEMRRAMETLVHQGKGLEAFALVDPLLTSVFDYVIGRPPSASTPHYEVAGVLSAMCTQNANCQMSDTLDLVIAFSAFIETPDGTGMLHRLDDLVKHPALEPFLSDDGQQYGGENGIVALADVLQLTVQGMQDPADLNSLPINQLPADLRPLLEAMLGDLKKMLDPNRSPNILRPMKRVLNCLDKSDGGRELVRMIYRLGFVEDVQEFGLTKIMDAVRGLRDTDERGTLIHLVGTLARAVREDEQAIDSAARVCQTVFSTRVDSGDGRFNAEQALPVIADLFRDGFAGEAICAVDTLVYGCAGGPQPACGAAE